MFPEAQRDYNHRDQSGKSGQNHLFVKQLAVRGTGRRLKCVDVSDSAGAKIGGCKGKEWAVVLEVPRTSHVGDQSPVL